MRELQRKVTKMANEIFAFGKKGLNISTIKSFKHQGDTLYVEYSAKHDKSVDPSEEFSCSKERYCEFLDFIGDSV